MLEHEPRQYDSSMYTLNHYVRQNNSFPKMSTSQSSGICDYVILWDKEELRLQGLPWWLRGLSVCLECGRLGFDPWVGKIPWRRKWQPTPVLLPGKSHGGRSLVGYSPWGRKESDRTERLHFHFKITERIKFTNQLALSWGGYLGLSR